MPSEAFFLGRKNGLDCFDLFSLEELRARWTGLFCMFPCLFLPFILFLLLSFFFTPRVASWSALNLFTPYPLPSTLDKPFTWGCWTVALWNSLMTSSQSRGCFLVFSFLPVYLSFNPIPLYPYTPARPPLVCPCPYFQLPSSDSVSSR